LFEGENLKFETQQANKSMSKEFKDYSARAASPIDSESDLANQEIQKQFYENKEGDNLLPFHVDINNPPIKK
jgi:hypothetical protein